MFISLTREYMFKISITNEDLDYCTDVADDGVIVGGETSPISGRVKIRYNFQVLDHFQLRC